MKNVGRGSRWTRPKSSPPSRMVTGTPRVTCTSSTRPNTTATATRIQKVTGNSSRLSSARFRHTSVMTLVTDMAAPNRSPIGANEVGFMPGFIPGLTLGSPGYQGDGSEHSAWQGAHVLHVLRLEFLAVFRR